MKVYALITGCYEDRWTSGIYSTIENAKNAWNPTKRRKGDYVWKHEDGDWFFDADWNDYAIICEFDLDDIRPDQAQ